MNAAFNFIPRRVNITREEKCARVFHSFARIAVDLSMFFDSTYGVCQLCVTLCSFGSVFFASKKKQKKNLCCDFSALFLSVGFAVVCPVFACSFPFQTHETCMIFFNELVQENLEVLFTDLNILFLLLSVVDLYCSKITLAGASCK